MSDPSNLPIPQYLRADQLSHVLQTAHTVRACTSGLSIDAIEASIRNIITYDLPTKISPATYEFAEASSLLRQLVYSLPTPTATDVTPTNTWFGLSNPSCNPFPTTSHYRHPHHPLPQQYTPSSELSELVSLPRPPVFSNRNLPRFTPEAREVSLCEHPTQQRPFVNDVSVNSLPSVTTAPTQAYSKTNKKFIPYPNLFLRQFDEAKVAAKRLLACPFGFRMENRTGGTGCYPTWRCQCPGKPQIRVVSQKGNGYNIEFDRTRFHEHAGARMPIIIPRVGVNTNTTSSSYTHPDNPHPTPTVVEVDRYQPPDNSSLTSALTPPPVNTADYMNATPSASSESSSSESVSSILKTPHRAFVIECMKNDPQIQPMTVTNLLVQQFPPNHFASSSGFQSPNHNKALHCKVRDLIYNQRRNMANQNTKVSTIHGMMEYVLEYSLDMIIQQRQLTATHEYTSRESLAKALGLDHIYDKITLPLFNDDIRGLTKDSKESYQALSTCVTTSPSDLFNFLQFLLQESPRAISADACPNLTKLSGCTIIAIGTTSLDIRMDTKLNATREFCPFCIAPTPCESKFLVYAIIRCLIRAGTHLFGITLGEDRINLSVWISDLADGLRRGCIAALPSTKLLPCYRHFQSSLAYSSSPWSTKYLTNKTEKCRLYLKSRLDLLHRCGTQEMIVACFPFALSDIKKYGECTFAEFFRGTHGPGSANGLLYRFNSSGIYGILPDNQPLENLFRIYQGSGETKAKIVNTSTTFHNFVYKEVPKILYYHSMYRQYTPMSSSLSTKSRHPDQHSLAILALMGTEDVLSIDGDTWLVNSPPQIGNPHCEIRRTLQKEVMLGDLSSPPLSHLKEHVLDRAVAVYMGYCVVRRCGTGPNAHLHKKLLQEHQIKYVCETCVSGWRHMACPATFLVSSINNDLPHHLPVYFRNSFVDATYKKTGKLHRRKHKRRCKLDPSFDLKKFRSGLGVVREDVRPNLDFFCSLSSHKLTKLLLHDLGKKAEYQNLLCKTKHEMISLALAGTTLAKDLILDGSISRGQLPMWVMEHSVVLRNRRNDPFFYPCFRRQIPNTMKSEPVSVSNCTIDKTEILCTPVEHPFPQIINSGCELWLLSAHQGIDRSLTNGCVVISSLIAIHYLTSQGGDMFDSFKVCQVMKTEAVSVMDNLRSEGNHDDLIAMTDLLKSFGLFDRRLFSKMGRRKVNPSPYDKICHQNLDMGDARNLRIVFEQYFEEPPAGMMVAVLFLICDHQVVILRDSRMQVHILDSLPSIEIQGSPCHDGLYSTRVVCPTAALAAKFLHRKWQQSSKASNYQQHPDSQIPSSQLTEYQSGNIPLPSDPNFAEVYAYVVEGYPSTTIPNFEKQQDLNPSLDSIFPNGRLGLSLSEVFPLSQFEFEYPKQSHEDSDHSCINSTGDDNDTVSGEEPILQSPLSVTTGTPTISTARVDHPFFHKKDNELEVYNLVRSLKHWNQEVFGPIGIELRFLDGSPSAIEQYFEEPKFIMSTYLTQDNEDYHRLYEEIRVQRGLPISISSYVPSELVKNKETIPEATRFDSMFQANDIVAGYLRQNAISECGRNLFVPIPAQISVNDVLNNPKSVTKTASSVSEPISKLDTVQPRPIPLHPKSLVDTGHGSNLDPWNIWDRIPVTKIKCFHSFVDFFNGLPQPRRTEKIQASAWSVINEFRLSGKCDCCGNVCGTFTQSIVNDNKWIGNLNCDPGLSGILSDWLSVDHLMAFRQLLRLSSFGNVPKHQRRIHICDVNFFPSLVSRNQDYWNVKRAAFDQAYVRAKFVEWQNQVFNPEYGNCNLFQEEINGRQFARTTRRKRIAVNVFDTNKYLGIFIPIPVYDHFIAAVVCHDSRKIMMLDWLHPTVERKGKLKLHGLMIRHTLAAIQGNQRKKELDMSQYEIVIAFQRQIQIDSSNCGVFTLMCMWRLATLTGKVLLEDAVSRLETQLRNVDIWTARYWICLCILNGKIISD